MLMVRPVVVARGYACAGVVPLACLRGLAECSWCAGGGGGVYLRRDGERMPEACLPGAHGGPRGGAVSIPEVWQVVRAWCPPPGLALRHVCGGSPCPCGGDVPEVVAGYTCAGVVPLACLRGLAGCSWCAGGGGGVYLRRDRFTGGRVVAVLTSGGLLAVLMVCVFLCKLSLDCEGIILS